MENDENQTCDSLYRIFKKDFFLLLWLLSSDVNRVFLSSILPQRSVFKKEKKLLFREIVDYSTPLKKLEIFAEK